MSVCLAPSSERDHPRMCGEHEQAERAFIENTGSSPHVRGARNLTFDGLDDVGIIPACAGSTMSV